MHGTCPLMHGTCPLTHGTCPLTKMYIPQGIAVEFNKNVQREITGNTTQYYQKTTKGFEFTDANFKIKAQKHSLKLQREISEKVSYSYLSFVNCTYSSGCTYLGSNMNITERDFELQKENVKS